MLPYLCKAYAFKLPLFAAVVCVPSSSSLTQRKTYQKLTLHNVNKFCFKITSSQDTCTFKVKLSIPRSLKAMLRWCILINQKEFTSNKCNL